MIYEYRCGDCDGVTTDTRPMVDRKAPCDCGYCGGIARYIVSATPHTMVMGGADNPGYVSPMSGKWIDSKRERRNEMQKYDVVEKG
jgi:putative FmdB family regulatory protein